MIVTNNGETVVIGRQYENEVTLLRFPISDWKERYGDGNFFLRFRRGIDEQGYDVPIEVDEEYVNWYPSSTELQYNGYGELQLTCRIGDKVAKSEIYAVKINRSIPETETVPEQWAGWVDQIEGAAATAINAASTAEIHAGTAEIAKNNAEEAAEQARQQAEYAKGTMGLAEFYINLEDGNLYVSYPTPYYGATFSINEDGYLEVHRDV